MKKNAVTTPLKKTAAKAPTKSPKTPAKSVSSSPPKAEPEVVEKEESKPSPSVETPKAEEKAVEPFQDLNEPSVEAEAEAEAEKEIPIEDAIEEEKGRVIIFVFFLVTLQYEFLGLHCITYTFLGVNYSATVAHCPILKFIIWVEKTTILTHLQPAPSLLKFIILVEQTTTRMKL